jgi:hypothetical protein
MDSGGKLFGTTPGGTTYTDGTVFELTPPSIVGGNWSESVLWIFGKGKDGAFPSGSLSLDASGNLYGTTRKGGTSFNSTSCNKGKAGSCGGTAFELKPPSTIGGNWIESVLWNFGKGKDGSLPDAGLIMDGGGNLLGTSILGGTFAAKLGGQGGTVFEISTRTVLNASPAELNFGNVTAPGTSKPKKVTLSNKGTNPAQISTVTVTAPFTIAGGANSCSGKTVAPKKSCSIEIEFAPITVADVTNGSIDVTYNGASPALALVGNGVAK